MELEFLDDKERDIRITKVKKSSSNKRCFDCNAKNPQWMSASFGIFVCIKCSGIHRSYGPNISFVRSCDMDKLQEAEVLSVEIGGNGKARQYLKKIGLEKFDYKSSIAGKYRRELKKKKSGEDDFYEEEEKIVEVEEQEVVEEVVEEKKKIDKKKLKKKKFKVNFKPKFKKGGKKSKKLAAKKIDIDLDFNVMTVGDVVKKKKEDPLAELKEELDFKVVKNKGEEEEENKGFGGMTGIGSDSFKEENTGKKPKANFKNYKNLSGFGSDQLNGKKKTREEKITQKIDDTKHAILTKANDWYDKLKTKWNKKT